MNEFLEYDENKKAIKTLNLDDFSVEDLNKYIIELKTEIVRVEKEIQKKTNLLSEAQKFFN
jgi:Protein of unknown function (DUF1192).